jgi:CBS domain-containing membrane protein
MSEPITVSRAILDRLHHWLPAQPGARLAERLIAGVTAFVGILAVAGISAYFLGMGTVPFMIGSMGASAVLLFAVPHSPLAHPWSFVGSHLVSALIGVLCARYVPDLLAASALAVGAAIFIMHTLRCLHPPGGATALIPVLGDEAVRQAGFGLLVAPIGLNVLVLMVVALVINNLLPGRSWPLRHAAPKTAVPGGPLGRLGLTREDLDTALREMNAVIDVDESDLEEIFAKAAVHAQRRRLGEVRIADIMRRDVPTAEYGDALEDIWALMRADRHKGIAVVNRARRVIGIVTIVDFLKRANAQGSENPIERLTQFIRRTTGLESEKPEVVGQLMTSPVVTVREDAHIVSLAPLFAEDRIHHVPVVDREDRLVGMVTQSDLMAALHQRNAALS